MDDPTTIVYETDLTQVEESLDQIILLLQQNQQFIGEIHYLLAWFIAGITGIFILAIIYHLVSKFIR